MQPESVDNQRSSSASLNPYAVTTVAEDLTPRLGSDVEVVRRYYLSHEASVKSIGSLNFLLGALILSCLTLFSAATLIHALSEEGDAVLAGGTFVFGSILVGLGSLMGFTGWGLWELKPWARIVATLISCLGLVLFPLGTIINVYFLYLLLSEKANVIFSEEYQGIIRQTPHIKYKTPLIAWLALGTIIVLFAIIISLAALPTIR